MEPCYIVENVFILCTLQNNTLLANKYDIEFIHALNCDMYIAVICLDRISILIVNDSMNVNVSAFFPPECIYPEYSSTYMSYKNLV